MLRVCAKFVHVPGFPVVRPPITAAPSSVIPVVTLAELPALAAQLAAQVRSAGRTPQVVVYVERGARLLATEMCAQFRCRAIAVTVQRRGGGLKRALAGIVARFPRRVRDALRRADERWLWSRGGGVPRAVRSDFSGSLATATVLLVDDAADSGRTIAGCLEWLAARGATRDRITIAVLAATTPAGRAAADYWVLERNTRLPWSSDSAEKALADARAETNRPPSFP